MLVRYRVGLFVELLCPKKISPKTATVKKSKTSRTTSNRSSLDSAVSVCDVIAPVAVENKNEAAIVEVKKDESVKVVEAMKDVKYEAMEDIKIDEPIKQVAVIPENPVVETKMEEEKHVFAQPYPVVVQPQVQPRPMIKLNASLIKAKPAKVNRPRINLSPALVEKVDALRAILLRLSPDKVIWTEI
jgi:hypothetical protein